MDAIQYAEICRELEETLEFVDKLRAERDEWKASSGRWKASHKLASKFLKETSEERDALVLKLIEVLDVCIARGEKLGYEDEDYRATRKEIEK
jgi:hypothetical protein